MIRAARRSDRAGGRAGRAVRQPRAERRHPQALGRRSAAVRARRRARSSSNRWKTSPPASTIRTLDVTPDDFLVLQNAGPGEPHRHAGGRLPADPAEARPGGRQGHGAHLGRAHERHRLRHRGAARVTPEAASGGPLALVHNGDRIRLCVARATASICWSTTRNSRDGARRARRRRRSRRAATSGCTRTTCCRPTHGCDFDFLRGADNA